MKQKVAIQYGIASGQRQGARMRRQLHNAGYTIVQDSTEADIIIAHSAGCFWLPEPPTNQKLMLIDPPHWPGKTIGERGRQRVRTNFHFRRNNYRFVYWLARNAWGLFYTVHDFKRTREIIRLAADYDLSEVIKNHRAILVRNSHDDWLTPELEDIENDNESLIVVHIPGDHDDCLAHPKPYVDLLKLLSN